MKNLFVPYEITIQLKEIEFAEPCLARYLIDGSKELIIKEKNDISPDYQAPLYQELLDWFENKHKIEIVAQKADDFPWYKYSLNLLEKNFKIGKIHKVEFKTKKAAYHDAFLEAINIVRERNKNEITENKK